jgi:hypothetical protein
MRCFYTSLIILCCYSLVTAQTLKGTISDSYGIVPFATVLIKHNGVISQYTSADENGFYSLILKKDKDSLQLEVSTLAHEPKIINLTDYKPQNNEILLDLKLENRVTVLKEVLISKKPAITQKKDTLEYNPERFKDGSEKVVEDLLKKLPGVKVEDNGEIKYKGKTIKKMLLDGDDLFDTNYTIGSKNINVDMIDKVQGIENYEENSLLKGIKDSEDVAINLVLKKGKTDISGNSTIGYGIEERYNGNVSGVLVNNKIKGFGISSFNNIGQNNTPYDFGSDIISLESIKNSTITSKSLLSEGDFNSILDNNFHRQNNNFYTSFNTLNKVFKKSNLKFNLGYYQDHLTRFNKNNSYITLENDTFEISELNDIKKNPQLYDFNIHFSNKEKESFHWEYLTKLNFNKADFEDLSSNNGIIQNSFVKSENLNLNQSFNSTYKVSENEALVTSFLFSKSKSPQQLITNPPSIIDENNILVARKQNSEFHKDFLSMNISYYRSKNNFKYAIHSRFFNTNNTINSMLFNLENESLGNSFENNTIYRIRNFNVNPILVYNKEKYSLKIGLNAIYNYIKLSEITLNKNEEAYFITPKITAIYRLNEVSNANFSYSFNQVLPDEDKLFSGIIQTNYRGFVSNELSLEYLKTHSYNLNYSYNNFFDLTQFNVNLNHNYRPNNYFYNNIIRENITVSNQFFASIGTKDYNLTISGEKYYHPLRTTFQFNSAFMLSFNSNIINESEIRKIRNETFLINFTARRGFKKILNIENKTSYLGTNFKIENENGKNNFQTLTNQTKITLKSKNYLKNNLIGNLISPNLNSKTKYFFLDYELNYTPNNKKITYSILGKNLTNNKTFTTKSVSDFSSNTSSHNLIERYVMFRLTFGF